jgi:exonuclease III
MYNVYNPDIIAIQETKIDRNILTSKLFPDNFTYDVYRNDRTLNGGVYLVIVWCCLDLQF